MDPIDDHKDVTDGFNDYLRGVRDTEARYARLVEENYSDLLDQMDAAWGNALSIGREEINAFLESRVVHKPTTRLREKYARVEKVLEQYGRDYGDPEKEIERLFDEIGGWQDAYLALKAKYARLVKAARHTLKHPDIDWHSSDICGSSEECCVVDLREALREIEGESK